MREVAVITMITFHRICFCTLNKFGVHNAMHVSNDRLNLMPNHFTTDNGMRAATSFQSAKINVVLLFGFSPVAISISNRFECVISQMKGNKFLIYYF